MVKDFVKPQSSDLYAPLAPLQRLRSYSRRKDDGTRETWDETCDRVFYSPHLGLKTLGKFTDEEMELIDRMQRKKKAFGSARGLWVQGTEWFADPDHYPSTFNCSSFKIINWNSFGILMDLAMMGCGTGATVELEFINQLPAIVNKLNIELIGEPGDIEPHLRIQRTSIEINEARNAVRINVGDSRQGWVEAYQCLLEIASDLGLQNELTVFVDNRHVRPKGEPLKRFGGVANPIALPALFNKVAKVLNNACGRKLNSLECCLIINEAAGTVVSGNIRRCIASGERVPTSLGFKPIEEIQIGDLVLTSSGEYKKVVGKFDQGIQDVVEIITPFTTVKCTANHRVAVFDGFSKLKWKHAGELIESDRLVSVPHCKGIESVTEDEAWLLGYFLGDGYADLEKSKKRKGGGGEVVFALSSYAMSTVGEKLIRILTQMGYSPTPNIDGGEARIAVYRKDLAEFFHQYKPAFTEPSIPDFVWGLSANLRGAFLAGLADADGDRGIKNVLLNNTYPFFLRQVQRLYLSLGIATSFHERPEKLVKGKLYRGCHYLKIRGIQSQSLAVGMINPHSVRVKAVVLGQKKNGLDIPYQIVQEEMALGWRSTVAKQTRSLIQDSKSRPGFYRNANWDTLLQEGVCEPHWLPIEVLAVAPAGESYTWDIEVEDNHNFVCEGILVHNSANIQQGSSEDQYFTTAKDDLWQVDDRGNWRVDPDRDALRMANLTRVYHHKPTLKECVSAVQKQFFSGEGAIQWAGESVARCNADLLDTPSKKQEFLDLYAQDRNLAKDYLSSIQPNCVDIRELNHRMDRYQGNPCFEIHSTEFFCNLSSVHLNQIDPFDLNEQADAFTASALQVAAYLQRGFTNPRYQYSRDLDPIVGVSFTGAFTFFVKAFGTDWLKWWQSGRPEGWNPYDLSLNNIAIQNAIRIGEKLDIFYHPAYATLGEFWKKAEKEYLNFWRSTVEETIKEYCDRHNLKCPNRSTTLKPEGSLTLLTGVGACGWHPPKAKHYIRRMTFGAYDPIALAAVDYGYSIVPSQSCKDENGRLLDDPFDPRVTEWLVEVPVEEPWANLPGVEDIDPSAFPIEAQWDFYMMCQKHYVRHNGSATLEIYEDEVETLAKLIYNSIQNDEGYISAAILGRSKGNLSFPRLPFEPVTKEKYDELVQGVLDRRISDDFMELIAKHDNHESLEPQDSACDGGACLLK